MPPLAHPGRFVAALTGHALLDAVGEIAREAVASPDLASGVSKRRFDETRRRLGRTDVPGADTIRQRLKRPWDQVVRAALAHPKDRGHVLGQGHSRSEEFAGPERLALAGIRSAALAVGCAPSMDAYDAWLAERNRDRDRRGLAPLILPSSATLISSHGSWRQSLAAAGLRIEDMTDRAAGGRIRDVRPAEETLSDLIDLIGMLPPSHYLQDYCRLRGIPLGREARRYSALIQKTRALRQSQGKWTPERKTARADCPLMPERPASAGDAKRRVKRHTLEAVLDSLRRYGERHLVAGQMPTERHYRVCRSKDDELISASSFPGGVAFQDLCRQAGL